MGKTSDEVLGVVLSSALGLDDKGVAELKESDGSWKDDAADHFKKLDADRIKALKDEAKAAKEEREAYGEKRFGEGKALSLGKLESEIRKEFGVNDENLRGIALVKQLVEMQKQAANATDEAKIKTSKAYMELEAQIEKNTAEFDKRLADKEAEITARFEGEQNYQTVINEAADIFDAWEPVLPEDKTKAANLKRDFLEKLRRDKFQVQRKDGKVVGIVPMQEDGKTRLEDEHGKPISLKALVESRMGSYFEQVASEKRSSAPDPNKVGNRSGDGGSGNYPATMTQADYMREYEKILNMPKADREKQLPLLEKHGRALGLVK